MKKFWKNANFALKTGMIITAIFLIIGFVIYFIPHTDPFTFNTYDPKLGSTKEHILGTTSKYIRLETEGTKILPWVPECMKGTQYSHY